MTRVEPDRGLLIPGLAIPYSRNVFYISEDGFYSFDYTTSKPIGKDRMSRHFFDDWDSLYPDRVWGVSDPDSTRIWVIYPGSGNTDGLPNRVIVYDWALDEFSTGTFDMELIIPVIAPGINLDTLPDDNLDTFEPTTSFDDRISETGARTLGGYDSTFKLGTLTGAALTATLETGTLELTPGRRSCTSYVRPIIDGADRISIAVAALKNIDSPVNYGLSSEKDADGKCPLRKDGRYHRFRVQIGDTGFTGFDFATALDVAYFRTGMR